MVAFNFFFLPPVGTLSIADPQNWVALFTFLAVSLVASNLSSRLRAREREAVDRRDDMARLFEERRQLLEARNEAEVSRRGEELKSALLASLGHDLRTPLTAIRVAASNLQASWLTPDERLEQNRIVLDEVDRLTRLFQNILDMARIEAGEVSANAQWVHPSEIVGAARDLVPQALRDHPLDLQIVTDVLVKVDPRLTAAALSHLLENAAQYSPPGARIEVAARIGDGEMTLSISDSGPGIIEADLPRLFERFYRGGHGKKRAGGTGMGLSIAQGLIAAERGRIWAENRPEGGARFTIGVAAESGAATSELAES